MSTAAVDPSRLSRRVGAGLALAAVGVGASATAAAAEDYVVQPGDTVSHIALRSHTTVGQIVAANGLDARATIRAGQTLTIPTAPPAPVAAPAALTRTVVAGDTVWDIARATGATVDAIVAANGLDARAGIRVGQVLTIPGAVAAAGATTSAAAAAAPTTASRGATHTVVAGDTLSAIADRYRTTVSAITSANGLADPSRIRIGEVLAIPGGPASGLVGDTFAGRTYPAATVSAANENKATLLASGVPSRDQTRQLVAAVARDMGVDPALAQAVAYQESGFDQTAVSPANAVGVMQVIPSSGDWASDLVGRELNLLDARDNVVAGCAILRRLVETSPDLSSAIAGYYQGQRSVATYGMFDDTRRYVANVRTHMSRFA